MGDFLSSLRTALNRIGDTGPLEVYELIDGSDGEVVILQTFK